MARKVRIHAGCGAAALALQMASGGDVAPAASVSFIEPGTLPRTVATTVTTDDGRFVLDLGSRFVPAAGSVYYLCSRPSRALW